MKRIFSIISIIAILLTNYAQPVLASSQDDPIFRNLNGIYYYDGQEECISPSSGVSLAGNTNAEKVWNFFKGLGYTDEAVAGIIGNWQAESGVEPKKYEAQHIQQLSDKHDIIAKEPTLESLGMSWSQFQGLHSVGLNEEGYLVNGKHHIGLGLGQWTGPRNVMLWEFAGKSDKIWDLGTQLKFMTEKDTKVSWLENYKNFSGTPEEAAREFMSGWEGVNYKVEERMSASIDAYETFKGTSPPSSGTSSSDSSSEAPSINSGKFMFIGDSITDGVKKDIATAFPNSSVNAYVGRGIGSAGNSGDSVLDFINKNISSIGDTVVINIGTNDNFDVENGKKMLEALRGKKIYLVNNFGLGGNANFETINKNIAEATNGNSFVQVLDWKAHVEKNGGREKFYAADGYHLNAEGQKLYIEFLKSSITEGNSTSSSGNGCSGGGGLSGNNGSIVDRAIELAIPEDQAHRAYAFEVTDKQREALQKTGLVNYGDAQVQRGSSCDAFVSMVMSTTVDPDYVKHCCGVANLRDYMARTPEKYEKIPFSRDALRPGDIMTAGRGGGAGAHIQIYVEIGGEGKVANGGYGRTTGVIEPLNIEIMQSLGELEIWRWKG